jgi:hypothetical protein
MGRSRLFRQRASVTWVPAGTLIVIALRLSEIGPRARDAPRASMRSRSSRAHHSRIEIDCSIASRRVFSFRAETKKAASGTSLGGLAAIKRRSR